ncbi:hypothetical protein GQ54DRAFT_289048 [Martensiomyces pterosporus]|nr:hypothetical protein GQ54DRAFT_289048 [Martensiomyces pterosporus]
MQLSVPPFKFGSTVVLAYPDTTRLAGYRAALGLWGSLAGNTGGSEIVRGSFNTTPEEIVQPGVSALSTESDKEATEVPVVFGTAAAASDLTFCFVSGLPSQELIPSLVGELVDLFEANGVSRVVAPAAVNLSNIRDSDRLWVHVSTSPKGGVQTALPGGAQTNDAFLSALDNIASVSGISEASLLVHGDKRPSGSGYRQNVVFGSEYVDESDSRVVWALAESLATAVGIKDAIEQQQQQQQVEATRIRIDAELATRSLATFS